MLIKYLFDTDYDFIRMNVKLVNSFKLALKYLFCANIMCVFLFFVSKSFTFKPNIVCDERDKNLYSF